MKIEIVGERPDHVPMFITTPYGVKFTVENIDREKLCRLFFSDPVNQHVAMLKDKSQFIAAGMVKEGGAVIEYDSNSCREKIGRDHPENLMEAETLRTEIRLAVEEWLKTINT